MPSPQSPLAGLLGLLAAALSPAAALAADAPMTVYVGTYTDGVSRGIYRFEFDPATGAASPATLAAEAVNPSFLAFQPDGRRLYAVNEIDSFGGERVGSVTGFAVDPSTGALATINARSSGGSSPCFLVVDKSGRDVLAANYGGGSVAVLPVEADGRLGVLSSFRQHSGKGGDPARQQGPHAHSINLDAANRYAAVADLGLDKILVYKFDPEVGLLTPNDPPSAATAPAAGPRHLAFHPDGRHAYVINELNSTVTAWDYDADRGVLTPKQTLSTLPEGFKGTNYPADIRVHPSGKFVYGSNRGHNSIVTYAVDPASGRLTYVGNQSAGIKNPRNFTLDPTGKFLLVANQDLGTVVVFRVDPAAGAPEPTGRSVKVPKPVCLLFRPPAR